MIRIVVGVAIWLAVVMSHCNVGAFAQGKTVVFQAPLATRGLWVQFERRGWPVEYWQGQVVQNFNQFDSVVGSTVAAEVGLQLDVMSKMGVNTVTLELRSADPAGANPAFPTCALSPALGFQWPQPTSTELANFAELLSLINRKRMKVILVLTNMHMEEQPPTNSQTWLGAIFNVLMNQPAIDFVVFNGDAHTIDTNGDGIPDACGIQAEAPLWLGVTAIPATYVQWAINYAVSLGWPVSKASSGAVVGDYFTDSEPPGGPGTTGGHLWPPILVMKQIFDNLGIPNNQRLYALSFYEHNKCATARGLPCTDADPPTWADQTLGQEVYGTIGTGNGARVVAYEMGNMTPVNPNWSTAMALGNLLTLLRKYGAGGGSFWRWTSFMNSEDSDPTLATPIKVRGTNFIYNQPVQTVLSNQYLGTCNVPGCR
jgi:hypothetical protein